MVEGGISRVTNYPSLLGAEGVSNMWDTELNTQKAQGQLG